nr:immunoglobulin heavy chain junction region [Macaca mulatta]MOY22731.1 immunoglobulin heavy chain junction region [Macaca mulatta]MOY22869.1 immunoglobulin heavy chain junction region [Macaca mulatta]MOY23184.1 immunoglobulin heavy chain junction region [Macaca mulatta]MOY23428.1 immunoglobulin heavy chain junction region [Macaca mulatta]
CVRSEGYSGGDLSYYFDLW